MRNKNIDPDVTYSLKEVADARLLSPFFDTEDIRVYRKVLDSDRRKKNMLRAFIIGEGRQRRYKILGKNILAFLAEIETGTYQL